MELYEGSTKPTARRELGKSDSSLQLVEPAIDRFVARRTEGGSCTLSLSLLLSFLSSSQQARTTAAAIYANFLVCESMTPETPGGDSALITRFR